MADDSRTLATSSGNAQTLCNASDKLDTCSFLSSRIILGTATERYPAPTTTLRSNDHRVPSNQKFKTQRLQKRYELAKRCWSHPAYIKYLHRPRKDVDKKGETIWRDDVERAFSNAIVNIPAMGKSKKSQHGKACGRNELIQEWILQETGKIRHRKQVSSHLQVFDGMFKGIPEWRALNKVSKNSNSDDIIKEDEYEYYSNSIADMVRVWTALGNRSHDPAIDSEADHLDTPVGDTSLTRLYFEMWISQPEKIDQALHRYTQVQYDQSIAPPDNLESIEGWRIFWPDLVPIVEARPSHGLYDIILLETSLQLKDDFPPPKSKLGISLELEFSSSSPDRNFFATAGPWSCISQFYQKGKLEARAEYKKCHSLGPGRVDPPFESKWWAEKFVQLTKRRRQALDFGDDAAVVAADESTKDYLDNLKVMQQIFLGPESIQSHQDLWHDYSSVRKRITVLLWSFSQTSEKYVGVTTWKRLLPPPRRMDVNSPSMAAIDMSLPPFNMDSTMDINTNESLFSLHSVPLVSTLTGDGQISEAPEQECVSQNATAPFPSHTEFNDDLSHENTYTNSVPLEFQHFLDLQHHLQRPQEPVIYDSSQSICQAHPILPSNYFEAREQWDDVHHVSEGDYYHDQHTHRMANSKPGEEHSQREPLLHFDMNTHALLQVQLEAPSHDSASSGLELQQHPSMHEPNPSDGIQQTQPTDHQASLILTNDIAFDGNAHLRLQSEILQKSNCKSNEESMRVDQPRTNVSTANRPALHHHHTFAGHPQFESESQLSLSNTSRNELALLLEGFPSKYGNAEAQALPSVPNAVHGLGLARPHSQPLPLATASPSTSTYHDAGQPLADDQVSSQGEWVEVKLES